MRNELHLAPRAANFQPLSPLDFLDRARSVHPDRLAVVWHGRQWTYAGFGGIVARLADFLTAQGVGPGDVVSVMLPNRPEMLAAHYAVPMLGAVLNTVNTRLDADTVAYILTHAETRLILGDPATADTARAAGMAAGVPVFILETAQGPDLLNGAATLPDDLMSNVTDEWQAIAINYTSGTTGRPKGVVYHHRGAYLNALGNVLTLGLTGQSVYLWVLPMFHCNGWCHTWAVTAAGGVHVCLDRVDAGEILASIPAQGVTHMACAPVVLYMMLNHPDCATFRATGPVTVASGGASPSAALIAGLEAMGLTFLHLYGLTESYGPATLCRLDATSAVLPGEAKAQLLSRQGSRHATASHVMVLGPDGRPVPMDGATPGEIMLRGNTLMAGYYRDAPATDAAFAGGALNTGDIAVRHPNAEIEIRDRAKDVIISGGENISSLEVENALHRHPAVLLAAVVAAPDAKWGEVPCAFVELKPGHTVTPDDLRDFARSHIAHYKVPRRYVFGDLPKTATGKIQKYILRDRARQGTS